MIAPGKPPAFGYRGVVRHPQANPAKPWWARIRVGKTTRSLGLHPTAEAAAHAYDDAARLRGVPERELNYPHRQRPTGTGWPT